MSEESAESLPAWLICADAGGTFTDCIARDPQGGFQRFKVLSSSSLRGEVVAFVDPFTIRVDVAGQFPDNFFAGFSFRLLCAAEDAGVIVASSRGCELSLAEPIDLQLFLEEACELNSPEPAPLLAARLATKTPIGKLLPKMELRVATTRGTNALLERDFARATLFTTEGFEDVLQLADGTRDDLFTLNPSRRSPLTEDVMPIPERVNAKGKAIYALDADEVRVAGFHARENSRVAVVSFLNAWANDEHEAVTAALLREAGFDFVVEGAQESPGLGFLRRSEHAMAEGVLASIISTYLKEIAAALGEGSTLSALNSTGGLVPAADYRAAESLLSGPAGGAAGLASVAKSFQESAVLGFDMGGTSTDVVRWAGDFDFRYQTALGDARVATPSLAIETVAAGGGSISWWDGQSFQVGPQSAGAKPGPASYGAGGPLTLTDVNLLLRRVKPEEFGIPLSLDAAEEALSALMEESGTLDREGVLLGLIAIANERMAEAIRGVSLRRGFDPAEHALVAFGGAGGVHACEIADLLGITRVIHPSDAGILSAYGLAHATPEASIDAALMRDLHDCQDGLADLLDELGKEASEEATARGALNAKVSRQIARMRVVGQDETLDVEIDWIDDLEASFDQAWARQFGYPRPLKGLEVVMLRVIARGEESSAFPPALENTGATKLATLFLPDHWQATNTGEGFLCTPKDGVERKATEQPLAVERALYAHRFTSIAEEMGEVLRRSSLSTNIRERLDFSCALLDGGGEMLVNAPHIPVHLGALGLCVRLATAETPLAEGETLLTNHPAFGGSHLPDLTLVSSVFFEGELLGYVASRAHHAEIGGVTPGSMPPNATKLVEEGVVVPPTTIASGEQIDEEAVLAIFSGGPHPSRQAGDNLADLRAQLNANCRGVAALQALAAKVGVEKVREQMSLLADHADAEMRATLAALPDGTCDAMEELDDGTLLCVEIVIDGDSARVDFTGTSPSHRGNLNATPAIVNSALIYVLRLLVGRELPLNEGMLRSIDLHIPEGSILSPDFLVAEPPAVVGGNVETSQRLVDTLLKALGIAAASQGTMNNLLFGNDDFSYYETIPGGVGATANSDGASALQIHMTNTRITDVEVLEHRYPLRVERFGLRDASGGAGQHSGGDGVIRELLFLAPVTLSFMAEHRRVPPFGVKGAEDGQVGTQYLVRPGGKIEELSGRAEVAMLPGDRFVVETPGGGGFSHSQSALLR